MMKKFWKILFVCMAVCALFLLPACKKSRGSDTPDPDDDPPPAVVPLRLNTNEITLTLGNTEQLTATYTQEGTQAVQWSSSNDAVASVQNGLVTANDVGTATVTATYGEQTATCAVTVDFGTLSATVTVNGYDPDEDGDGVNIAVNDTLDLNGSVRFNGKTYTDARLSYRFSDESIGQEENGIFTAKKKGVTTVTVQASWRGLTSIPVVIFDINVISNVAITVNGGATNKATLYTAESWAGKTDYVREMDFVVGVTDNGVAKTPVVAILDDGAQYVQYDASAQKITALKEGEAVVRVSYNDGAEVHKLDVPVTVMRPVAMYTETLTFFSAADGFGDVALRTVFASDTGLADAYQGTVTGNDPATWQTSKALGNVTQDGKINGLVVSDTQKTDTYIKVYGPVGGYIIPVEAYTKVIRTAEDLRYLEVSASNPHIRTDGSLYTVGGYVVLRNDITDAVTITHGNIRNDDSSNGFGGIFDGLGHSLVYKQSDAYGLFGNLVEKAIVRNFAVTCTMERNGSVLCQYSGRSSTENYQNYAQINNVYVRVLAGAGNMQGVIRSRLSWVRIRNVVIEVEDDVKFADSWYTGALFGGDQRAMNYEGKHTEQKDVLYNVYLISKQWATNLVNTSTPANSYRYYGVNENRAADEYEYTKDVYDYVYRTENAEDMIAALAAYENKSDGFNSFWSVASGMPVWLGGGTRILVNGGDAKNILLSPGASTDFAISVFKNGEAVQDAETDVQVTGTAVTYNKNTGKLVAGNDRGEATVTVTYNDNGTPVIVTVNVTVNVPVSNYAEKLTFFSAVDGFGDLDMATAFGENITSAYQGNTPLTVRDNKIFGLSVSATEKTTTEITVYSANKGYIFQVEAYTKVMRTVQDLQYLAVSENNANIAASDGKYIVNGYIVLANDIDDPDLGVTSASTISHTVTDSGNGFAGVFDGLGHSIAFRAPTSGLFGRLLANAVVKNVDLQVVIVNWNSTAIATSMAGTWNERNTTLQNVHIHVSRQNGSYVGVLGQITQWGRLRSMVVEVDSPMTYQGAYRNGSMFGLSSNLGMTDGGDGKAPMVNVYLIADHHAVETNYDNSRWYGVNEDPDADTEWTATKKQFGSLNGYDMLYRTETVAEMHAALSDYANKHYGFDSAYWDLSGNMPVWVGAGNH